ncbi:MAG: hypothetical protein ACJ8C4_17450 [Gemmataceae bacterium]
MVRTFWLFVVIVSALAGCRHNCCYHKPSCNACTTPPGPIIAAPTPSGPNTPEILMPQQQTPAPQFPAEAPRTSGFVPAPQVTQQPAVTLERPIDQPTTTEQTVPPRGNPTSQTKFTEPLPGNITVVTPGYLFTGSKPSLDDLDRLAAGGVRRVLFLSEANSTADERVFESRGLQFLTKAGDVAPIRDRTPTYVYADTSATLRGYWIRYFREVESLSDDAAQVRADRLVSR